MNKKKVTLKQAEALAICGTKVWYTKPGVRGMSIAYPYLFPATCPVFGDRKKLKFYVEVE
jgi:hypothetical protein